METFDLEKLQDMLEKHRLWSAGDSRGERLELREVSLVGVVLPQVDFSKALLCDVDFSGAELRHAGFTGAQLERVLFREAALEGASFLEARLTDCSFERARFAATPNGDRGETVSGPDFQKAELKNVSFCDGILPGAEFADARLQIVVLDRADLRGADFVSSHVTDSSFAGAQLNQSNLAKASFSNVTLRGANLHKARLKRWSCRARCDLCGADLSGADLAHADFDLLDLRHANIKDAKLSKTRIRTSQVHATHGLPFVYDVFGDTVLDFSEHADASDPGDVLRFARQLGDDASRARFGAGVGTAYYRCRALGGPGGPQFLIETVERKAQASQEAIRVVNLRSTDEDGLSTLHVKYELIDKRFHDWDPLAHELIFELVLLGELKDRYRTSTDAILYINTQGGTRMTDYG